MGETRPKTPSNRGPSPAATQKRGGGGGGGNGNGNGDEGGGGGGGVSQPSPPPPPPVKTPKSISLVQPSQKKNKKSAKAFRVFRSMFRSFPIITPACKLPSLPGSGFGLDPHKGSVGSRITGTLFGYRRGRVSFSLQENPRCLPSLVLELGMQTCSLQKELGSGMVRIALECEKRLTAPGEKQLPLLEESVWAMYCNGKKNGYGIKREANEEDLYVMELLKAVSMGAGVLPSVAAAAASSTPTTPKNKDSDSQDQHQGVAPTTLEGSDTELAYMRAHFEHVIGSKDSETLYMLSPDGNSGPELTIFFVRI